MSTTGARDYCSTKTGYGFKVDGGEFIESTKTKLYDVWEEATEKARGASFEIYDRAIEQPIKLVWKLTFLDEVVKIIPGEQLITRPLKTLVAKLKKESGKGIAKLTVSREDAEGEEEVPEEKYSSTG